MAGGGPGLQRLPPGGSGYLLEHEGFRLVVDLGYATVPQLLRHVAAEEVDAVFISHGHPDHAGGRVLACTGDSGPSPDVVEPARGADVLLAEATHVDEVPEGSRRHLSSARQAGRQAAAAGVGSLLLTHLWPGTDPAAARAAAGAGFDGEVAVAATDLVLDLR